MIDLSQMAKNFQFHSAAFQRNEIDVDSNISMTPAEFKTYKVLSRKQVSVNSPRNSDISVKESRYFINGHPKHSEDFTNSSICTESPSPAGFD